MQIRGRILFAFSVLLLAFIPPGKKKIKVYLIGDSTMCYYESSRAPLTGWGMPFATFFDESVTIDNRAKGGRSTRTFISENRWQPIADSLQEGDYVLMQFGHNDEAKEEKYKDRYTPVPDYKKNLIKFINETRARKGTPVIITPVTRMRFDKDGRALETHTEYTAACYEVAKELDVPLIDLDRRSRKLLQKLGPEDAKLLFMQLSPGEHPNYPEGQKDNTHFNEYGARRVAELVLAEMREIKLELAVRVVVPKREYTVAQDGSGNYKALQEAFNAIPANNAVPVKIFVKNGIYYEKLFLDSTKRFVTITGEDKFKTILTYNDHTGKVSPKGDTINTYTSQSFFEGADDFTATNITFQNDAGFNAGQAVAINITGDRAKFINCRFVGNQDVLFMSKPNTRQYFEQCYIEGTTDFIFGPSIAWFEKSHIHSKKNSHITAASTPQTQDYGYVFNECILTGDSSLHNVSLGRPWRPFAAVAYINCFIGQHIKPEGWSNWNNTDNYKTTRYSEYKSYGPGGETSKRLSWTKQLSEADAKKYTLNNIFGDWKIK